MSNSTIFLGQPSLDEDIAHSMVQVRGQQHDLQPDDVLIPSTTLRDTLLQPEGESSYTGSSVRAVLAHHSKRFLTPWKPIGTRSAQSRTKIEQGSITLGQNLNFDVDDDSRKLAMRLADKVDMDEVEAWIMCRSYEKFSLDEDKAVRDAGRLDRLLLWWDEEVVAMTELNTAILRLGSFDTDWTEVTKDVRDDIMRDPAAYMEGIFRAFSGLAQRQLTGSMRSDNPVFWCRHQLRIQEALLQLLFLVLYLTTDRPPSISEALLKGCVMSGFGTAQANREYWESDPECQQSQTRIRDLLVVIAVESLCVGLVVNPGEQGGGEGTLLQSKSHIDFLHQFVLDQSDDLSPRHSTPEARDTTFPQWPIAVICLAWSIVLRSLPSDLAPTVSDFEASNIYQEIAMRAFAVQSGLFPWMEEILSGPLFEKAEEVSIALASIQLATFHRKVMKDLLIGTTELLNVDSIPDRGGLSRSWELVYGGGSEAVSLAVCADFWIADFPVEARRSLLDTSHFPLQATNILRILASLSSTKVADHEAQASFDVIPAARVCQYFNSLPGLTFVTNPSSFRFIGKDASGRMMVEAKQAIPLPGDITLPEGTTGTLISREDAAAQIVSWNVEVPCWTLLMELLQAAAGFTVNPPKGECAVRIDQLGIQEPPTAILLAGLIFLRSVLRPSSELAPQLLQALAGTSNSSSHPLIEVVGSILTKPVDVAVAVEALAVLQLLLPFSHAAWQSLRASGFFGWPGRSKSPASILLHANHQGDHVATIALLQVVQSLIDSASTLRIPEDDPVIRSALLFAFHDVWSVYPSWRYNTPAQRFEIVSLLASIFDTVLRHPISPITLTTSPAAQLLIDIFVTTASPLTFRPIVDTLTHASPTFKRSIATRHLAEAQSVIQSCEHAMELLSTLFRVSVTSNASTLPFSIFSASVASPSSDRLQLVDYLLELATALSTQVSTAVLIVKTVRTYLEATSKDADRPSLASFLRNPAATFRRLTDLTESQAVPDLKEAVWLLLSTIVATQPGCVIPCVGASLEGKVEGTLAVAIHQVTAWETTWSISPHVLAATLNYIQSVVSSPSASKAIAALRKDDGFWQATFDISIRPVPVPPTFQLSMHSDDFASRIEAYAYGTRAKANATAILATELALIGEEETDGPETKSQTLVLGLFRSPNNVSEAASNAIKTSCSPELHDEMGQRLRDCGVSLAAIRTVELSCEREYGSTYFYDGNPIIPHDPLKQSTVNLAIDMLNLNWSMLDADIALTKSWLSLVEVASMWTKGDGLAATAALRAAIGMAESLAEEDRGGDVMLAIQSERLSILATLLDTALDPDVDVDISQMRLLATSVRRMIESSTFSPISSLRHVDLPALHKPVLQIVHSITQSLKTYSDLAIIAMLEEAVNFVLESTDVLLDNVVRDIQLFTSDFGLVIGILTTMIKSMPIHIWLDKMAERNLIGRTLEAVVRMRLIDGPVPAVPPHIPLILLLHLALASNPQSAEKLAVCGILPAYSDNAIALLAESGSILPMRHASPLSTHNAWCSVLFVVKALLSCLPESASFVKSDIIPFIRVTNQQILRALTWDGESPLSQPALDELQLVTDVFYGIARALGAPSDLDVILQEYGLPSLDFLRSLRHALSHPTLLSNLIIPSTDEEHQALEKELQSIEDKEVDLVDFKSTPVIAARTASLLAICRTVLVTLVSLTRAWSTLRDEDINPETILEAEQDITSASSDPVGILNDIHLSANTFSDTLSSSSDPEGKSLRSITLQIAEMSALLSTAQLITRHATVPSEELEGGDMDVDAGGRRRSRSSIGKSKSKVGVLRELEIDLYGMLGGESGGAEGLIGWLRGVVEGAFGEA